MLAMTPKTYPWGDPNYWAEVKIDGIRAIIYSGISGETSPAYTRTGNLINSHRHPKIELPYGTILDSELLNNKFYCFDVIRLLDEDTTKYPLSTRRELLVTLVEGLNNPGLLVTEILDSSREAAQAVVDAGGEGVVLKRHNSPYRAGQRHPDWLKFKAEVEMDCVVMGLTSSTIKGYSNLSLGVYKEGKLVQIGTVKHSKSITENTKLVGKVAVVRGNKIFSTGHIRHPRITRFREDKLPEDCTGQ